MYKQKGKYITILVAGYLGKKSHILLKNSIYLLVEKLKTKKKEK